MEARVTARASSVPADDARRAAPFIRTLGVLLLALTCVTSVPAQVRLTDAADQAAFRDWFVLLADAAFYRPVAEVRDCAALIRYAVREALRPHTPEWLRAANLPVTPGLADVRQRPPGLTTHFPLFRVSSDPHQPYAEFADARTIVRFNARFVARDIGAVHPGDLLYYHQPTQDEPDHLMVVVGPSPFDRTANDFVVYHTGPDGNRPGEMRKVRLADLLRHPAPRWRPVSSNRNFLGVFRLTLS
jgi:uncharacterized protein